MTDETETSKPDSPRPTPHPSQGGEVEEGLQQKRSHTPRPMTGFWHTLTDEQKKAALEYDGPENHGPRDRGRYR